ncbi:unnamed protein product [Strongylus vulgaris]|uniref:Uncharacterized protein n=1 Tax=Strongylus vulgaris TaxID=40348 RepID=A0A3P7IUZ3_STRVU|nr:unnamed protein product [Strongylus vulgaris]
MARKGLISDQLSALCTWCFTTQVSHTNDAIANWGRVLKPRPLETVPCDYEEPSLVEIMRNVRGDKDVGVVFIPKSFTCRKCSGPQVARLPPQILRKVGLQTTEKSITDKEIEDADCYAIGWGITKGAFY